MSTNSAVVQLAVRRVGEGPLHWPWAEADEGLGEAGKEGEETLFKDLFKPEGSLADSHSRSAEGGGWGGGNGAGWS